MISIQGVSRTQGGPAGQLDGSRSSQRAAPPPISSSSGRKFVQKKPFFWTDGAFAARYRGTSGHLPSTQTPALQRIPRTSILSGQNSKKNTRKQTLANCFPSQKQWALCGKMCRLVSWVGSFRQHRPAHFPRRYVPNPQHARLIVAHGVPHPSGCLQEGELHACHHVHHP